MLESPAYRVLSLAAHRVLSRIEIEFLHHGGKDNGKLPVTYEQFVEYGMDRASIALAIRETEALGFIEVTERGCATPFPRRVASATRAEHRHDHLGNTGRKTGFWLEELAAPYYVFEDAGAPLSPKSPINGTR
jgi:hypothetical protein